MRLFQHMLNFQILWTAPWPSASERIKHRKCFKGWKNSGVDHLCWIVVSIRWICINYWQTICVPSCYPGKHFKLPLLLLHKWSFFILDDKKKVYEKNIVRRNAFTANIHGIWLESGVFFFGCGSLVQVWLFSLEQSTKGRLRKYIIIKYIVIKKWNWMS